MKLLRIVSILNFPVEGDPESGIVDWCYYDGYYGPDAGLCWNKGELCFWTFDGDSASIWRMNFREKLFHLFWHRLIGFDSRTFEPLSPRLYWLFVRFPILFYASRSMWSYPDEDNANDKRLWL